MTHFSVFLLFRIAFMTYLLYTDIEVIKLELCDVIRIRRSELGLTLAQVAEACGVGSSIVAKWERGEVTNLRRDSIKALADVLQVSPLVLLDREELPTKPAPFELSKTETYLLDKFRSLDSRGQSAVLNTLEHEYQAMHGDGSADLVPNNA